MTFRRVNTVAPSALASIKPTSLEAIYDLLERAGFSVEEWHRTTSGNTVNNFKSNPRFCYNWCFGSIAEGFALCLWYDTLRLGDNDEICFDGNVRDTKSELQGIANDPTANQSSRSRALDQAARANSLDVAIAESYARRQPVRVILCAGDRRSRDELAQKASSVEARYLDDIEWFVHYYEPATGACRIVRGVEPDLEVPAHPVDEAEGSATYEEIQQRAISSRRGQWQFRAQLLSAYRGACAITGTRILALLEAAHIVPHAQVTDYSTKNGLLLRADIHTLYDEHLLSIDARCTVHLSRALENTEYWKLHRQRLKIVPERSQDAPSQYSLERRHALFLEKEQDRR
ncbi:HNH endonuclease [Burkholderia singularis]|uniref:HNH endonuclease n=1 Tax=Burkholderia singularis TaxID=1503053 RepID=UPI000A75B998|nr:HNH endonuclease signature motif containing protein [Burkholderia singularis]